jgi:hypothetical protein
LGDETTKLAPSTSTPGSKQDSQVVRVREDDFGGEGELTIGRGKARDNMHVSHNSRSILKIGQYALPNLGQLVCSTRLACTMVASRLGSFAHATRSSESVKKETVQQMNNESAPKV